MDIDLDRLRAWIGRRREARERIAAAPLKGLAAALDRDEAEPGEGDEVPPGGHWLYFLEATRQSELGPDGHAARGGFLPPVPLPRRMWAGGRLRFLKPLRVGDEARRASEIREVSVKEGKSGAIVFVTVRHEIAGPAGLALTEEHDIVYRGAPASNPPPPPEPAPESAAWRRTIRPDPVLLFRYSALTFNGHRIHYDRPYATETEGYPDLVVHGPLVATLLMDLCRRQQGRLAGFDFRAVSPLFSGAPIALAGAPAADGRTAKLWAAAADGGLAMTATARFA
jgi:3-methylfumaryl-CoA hydratase